ncbi:MAG: hypothetical protein J6M54_05785 [Prevotella sp.]|nr:hypothetical protein [Prevotella sp.]MBQ9177527.1 hypothetical protein [Prevotella sp.]MBQ9670614.1 hypothetical protein [Prevotella sp.]MDY6229945.1 hypothetical protein [Prevotella sp.]MDY6409123.1 hypothetical protein [Prevotella sp.]
MKATEQTIMQIERAIRKIVQKFPASEDPELLTDIHIRVIQESGELLAFDDDEEEITRCVVEEWIDNKDDDFYPFVANTLRDVLKNLHADIDMMGIMKPYSFVLEDDEKENIAELYLADDDTIIIGGDIMPDLDSELDRFFDDLMEE